MNTKINFKGREYNITTTIETENNNNSLSRVS